MYPWISSQLLDSALPAGGFAHSGGLEAAVQLGRCRGAEGVVAHLREALWSAGTFALPFALAVRQRPARLAELDLRCDAATPGDVARQASRAQGRAFLRAAAAALEALVPLEEKVRQERLPGHLATVTGAVFGRLGADEEELCHAVLFIAARGIASAAVRLGVVGPLEAQRILACTAPVAAEVAVAARGVSPEDAATSAPLLDVLVGQQDRLYSKLFQS